MSKEQTAEDRLNNLLVEVRVLEGTFNELTSRQNLLERALLESRAALESIKEVDQKSPEVLLQIGGGAMLKAPVPATDKVLMGIGANVVIEKTKEEATAILESRSREMETTIVTLMKQRNEIAERLESDRQLVQTIAAQQEQQE